MPVRGFKLDSESHDLSLDDGGRLEYVTDDTQNEADEATAQEIKTRLLFFKGESFTDAREGVPYFQEVLIKGVSPERVRAIVRRVIQSHPSIVDVPVCELSLDRTTRRATVVWEARTVEGRVVRSSDYAPLIVESPAPRASNT